MEQEVWGLFPSEIEYKKYLGIFTAEYGLPVKKKRLAISFWDPNINNEIDTRIRVTDGKAELVQKCGAWENQTEIHMEEIDIPLPSDTQYLFNMYRVLRNNLPLTKSPFTTQYHNSLFLSPSFELKLTIQHGKKTRYSFEIEKLDDKIDLFVLARENGLEEYLLRTDLAFWNKWAEEMDVHTDDLSEDELKALIEQYLNYA